MGNKQTGSKKTDSKQTGSKKSASTKTESTKTAIKKSASKLVTNQTLPPHRRRCIIIKDAKHRGEWAELNLMARVTERGFNVSKPWGDSTRYDVAVERHGHFLRVQVKSTIARQDGGYVCAIKSSRCQYYTRHQVDFFAVYVIPEDVWYILPRQNHHPRPRPLPPQPPPPSPEIRPLQRSLAPPQNRMPPIFSRPRANLTEAFRKTSGKPSRRSREAVKKCSPPCLFGLTSFFLDGRCEHINHPLLECLVFGKSSFSRLVFQVCGKVVDMQILLIPRRFLFGDFVHQLTVLNPAEIHQLKLSHYRPFTSVTKALRKSYLHL